MTLSSRLAAASEADWGLDRELAHLAGYDVVIIKGAEFMHEPQSADKLTIPPYTDSIDAALELVERCLPEANCYGFEKTPKGVEGYVSRNHVSDGHWYYGGEAKTPALAICLALVRALEARK